MRKVFYGWLLATLAACSQPNLSQQLTLAPAAIQTATPEERCQSFSPTDWNQGWAVLGLRATAVRLNAEDQSALCLGSGTLVLELDLGEPFNYRNQFLLQRGHETLLWVTAAPAHKPLRKLVEGDVCNSALSITFNQGLTKRGARLADRPHIDDCVGYVAVTDPDGVKVVAAAVMTVLGNPDLVVVLVTSKVRVQAGHDPRSSGEQLAALLQQIRGSLVPIDTPVNARTSAGEIVR